MGINYTYIFLKNILITFIKNIVLSKNYPSGRHNFLLTYFQILSFISTSCAEDQTDNSAEKQILGKYSQNVPNIFQDVLTKVIEEYFKGKRFYDYKINVTFTKVKSQFPGFSIHTIP